MLNQNWSRWLNASIIGYFKNIADSIPIEFIAEGVDDRDTTELHANNVKLGVIGPFIKELSKDFYQINIEIVLYVTNLIKETNENAYDIKTWCGIFQTAMEGPISIYKRGSELGDDSSFVDCLIADTESIRIFDFGQIETGIRQAMINGKFKMDLKTL